MTLHAAEPRAKRWTREEYYRLAEQGWFDGQRVQLIDGEIIQMRPQGHAHAKAISVVGQFLTATFAPGHWVRIQMPLNVGRASDPEPDVCLAPRPMAEYDDHPTEALVVVEVADSSRDLDRAKARLYPSADVPEYWIVNLQDVQLEVYRQPVPRDRQYEQTSILRPGQSMSPLAAPHSVLNVADVFA